MSVVVVKKTETREREEIVAVVCDSCKRRFTDIMELQEMLRWYMKGGYNSKFGDGADISVDLCQECIEKRLGDCLQVSNHTWDAFLTEEELAKKYQTESPVATGWKCVKCDWSQNGLEPQPAFTEKPCGCCSDFVCPKCGGAVDQT